MTIFLIQATRMSSTSNVITMVDNSVPKHIFLPNEIQVLQNNKGVDIFYSVAQIADHTKIPQVHIKEFDGDIPIQNSREEIDFFLRCPTLVLEKRKRYYYPTYSSLKLFLSCVRFDENGYMKLVHPKLVFNICKIYMRSKGIFENCKIQKVYEGPASFLSVRKAESCNVRSTVRSTMIHLLQYFFF